MAGPSRGRSLSWAQSLADDNWADIERHIEKYIAQWGSDLQIVHTQKGEKITNDHDQTIEHFGYVDGISQPLFYQSDFIDGINTIYCHGRESIYEKVYKELITDLSGINHE